jgi:hypothetical protein
MKRFQAMCLATATVLAGAASAVNAAVFDEVPSDAVAVFEIRNLDQLNGKWGKFADSTGLAKLSPQAKDLIGTLEDQSGVSKGINTAGDFAIAGFQSDDQPPTHLALMPVSDYKAFLSNFPAGQEDVDGITPTTGKEGKDIFIAHWGDYAAIGQTKDLVAHKPQGIKLNGLAADALKNKDAIVYFNMDQVRTEELPELKQNRDAIIQKIIEKQKQADPAMEKLGWNLIFDQSEEFLQDAKSAVITMNITDDGISLGSAADFMPNTPFSQLAAAMKGTDQPLLAGLPDKKYLLLVGEALSPELKQQIQTMVLDPLAKQLDTTDAKQKALSDALATGKAKLAATDGAALGLVTPTGNPGQDSMVQLVGAITGDAAGWKKAELAGLQGVNDLYKNGDPNAPMTVTVDVKPDATTVGDVHLDQFSIKTDINGTGQRAMQAQRVQAMIFGPNGQSGYLGAVSDKVAMITLNVDDQSPLMADATAAGKAGKDVLSSSKSVQDISSKLPSPRVAEGFVFIDQIVGVVHYAQSMGLGIHFRLPADVAPIGFAISGDGTTARADAIIPASLAQAIVGAVNELKNGGGGGGGGDDNGGKTPAPGM